MSDSLSTEETITEFCAQGLALEPENEGESIDILIEVLKSLNKNFELISHLPDNNI